MPEHDRSRRDLKAAILLKVEGVIRRALESVDAHSADNRKAVYQRAEHGLIKIFGERGDDALEQVKADFREAVRTIELDYVQPTQPAPSSNVDDIAAIPPQKTPMSSNENEIGIEPKNTETPKMNTKAEQPKKSKAGIFATLLILAIAGVVAVLWAKKLPPFSQPIAWQLDLSNYANELSSASNNVKPVESTGAEFSIVNENSRDVLNITGKGVFYSAQSFEVDVTKSYELAIRLRTLPLDGVELRTQTLAGLATFDAQGKLENAKPGTHRYGLISEPVYSKPGWKTYSVIFTGTAADPTSFRPTTKTVRPVLLFNRNGTVPRSTQIEWLSFKEVVDATN